MRAHATRLEGSRLKREPHRLRPAWNAEAASYAGRSERSLSNAGARGCEPYQICSRLMRASSGERSLAAGAYRW